MLPHSLPENLCLQNQPGDSIITGKIVPFCKENLIFQQRCSLFHLDEV